MKSDRCLRCHQAVPPGMSVCRQCNPAGLPAPSPYQYHATTLAAILVSMVLLAAVVLLRG